LVIFEIESHIYVWTGLYYHHPLIYSSSVTRRTGTGHHVQLLLVEMGLENFLLGLASQMILHFIIYIYIYIYIEREREREREKERERAILGFKLRTFSNEPPFFGLIISHVGPCPFFLDLVMIISLPPKYLRSQD
jgi:hypothetical protein